MTTKNPLIACVLLPFILTACQTAQPQLLRDHSEPIVQEPEITPANYQYQRPDNQSTVLIIYFAEDKKDNIVRAITAKGDTVLYDYRIFNAVAIDVKDPKILPTAMAFYQKIDGVLQVSQDEMVQLD